MSDPATGSGPAPHAPLATTGRAVNAWSPEYVESMHAAWKADPASVDASWNQFFLGYELGTERPASAAGAEGGAGEVSLELGEIVGR